MNIDSFNKQARGQEKSNRVFFTRLKNKTPKGLDKIFSETHRVVFENTNCLLCANCCKTTSPVFYQRDIERAAKALGLKPGIFIQTYLEMDEDGDFVLKKSPCAFLDSGNACTIYHHRPAACREYPHTNRKNMRQILDLTFRNTLVCPAVLTITEKIKKLVSNV